MSTPGNVEITESQILYAFLGATQVKEPRSRSGKSMRVPSSTLPPVAGLYPVAAHESGGIAMRGDKESTLLGAGVGVGGSQVH